MAEFQVFSETLVFQIFGVAFRGSKYLLRYLDVYPFECLHMLNSFRGRHEACKVYIGQNQFPNS